MKTADMSDEEFQGAFERLEIPGIAFRHADHVRLAWIYLHDSEFAPGAANFCERFRRFVRHIDAEPKYHETITWFFLVTVFERIFTQESAPNWAAFALANADIIEGGIATMRLRYRKGTLARKIFVLPDLPALSG